MIGSFLPFFRSFRSLMTITPIKASIKPIVRPIIPLTRTFQLNAVIQPIITATPPIPPISPADSNAATTSDVASPPYKTCGNAALKEMPVEIIFEKTTFLKI